MVSARKKCCRRVLRKPKNCRKICRRTTRAMSCKALREATRWASCANRSALIRAFFDAPKPSTRPRRPSARKFFPVVNPRISASLRARKCALMMNETQLRDARARAAIASKVRDSSAFLHHHKISVRIFAAMEISLRRSARSRVAALALQRGRRGYTQN